MTTATPTATLTNEQVEVIERVHKLEILNVIGNCVDNDVNFERVNLCLEALGLDTVDPDTFYEEFQGLDFSVNLEVTAVPN